MGTRTPPIALAELSWRVEPREGRAPGHPSATSSAIIEGEIPGMRAAAVLAPVVPNVAHTCRERPSQRLVVTCRDRFGSAAGRPTTIAIGRCCVGPVKGVEITASSRPAVFATLPPRGDLSGVRPVVGVPRLSATPSATALVGWHHRGGRPPGSATAIPVSRGSNKQRGQDGGRTDGPVAAIVWGCVGESGRTSSASGSVFLTALMIPARQAVGSP